MVIALLAAEEGRIDDCIAIAKAAEAGKLQIVTSALTVAEVLKLKGHPRLAVEQRETINQFFMNDFILVRNVDRRTAELAQLVHWDHNIDPKDAIHVATALRSRADVMHTTDDRLEKRANGLSVSVIRGVQPEEHFGPLPVTAPFLNGLNVPLPGIG